MAQGQQASRWQNGWQGQGKSDIFKLVIMHPFYSYTSSLSMSLYMYSTEKFMKGIDLP